MRPKTDCHDPPPPGLDAVMLEICIYTNPAIKEWYLKLTQKMCLTTRERQTAMEGKGVSKNLLDL
jgi:hypothetical protein